MKFRAARSEADAFEIRKRAERRLYALKEARPKAKGGGEKGVGRKGKNAVFPKNRISTLADVGIDKILLSCINGALWSPHPSRRDRGRDREDSRHRPVEPKR